MGQADHVALLRAVNVGGHGAVAMADLCAAAESAGLANVITVAAAGTLVFAAEGAAADLEQRLEAMLTKQLGLTTCVMVRSRAQWAKSVADNPFPHMYATGWGDRLLLLTLKGAAKPGAEGGLRHVISGREEIVLGDGVAYVTYPNGIRSSKLTSAVLQRHLATPSTARNWNTVLKIAAALGR